MITGETGTGKEVVAQAIHQLSGRSKNAFVAVNCAAIPEALLEAELFGHVRGAFTGAVQSRLGRIHVAQGGTLFLDEVGELPLNMQAKLLRLLQNGEVQRLGSSDVYRVDVRVICATNLSPLEQVAAKQFRQYLYYRLAEFPIHLPPLRERQGDIVQMAEHFLRGFCAEAGFPERKLTPAALGVLEQRHRRGNVKADLATAFFSFTQAAGSLERSYAQLQAEVVRLYQELDRANTELERSLEENLRVSKVSLAGAREFALRRISGE